MIVRVLLVMAAALLGGAAGGATIHRDDGVHSEPWFVNQSFMFLKEEAEAAKAAGKGFAVIWEQPGCGACLRLHEVNFQDKALADYIGANFTVMVMNLFGEIEVTDFDGEAMPEK